MENWLLIFVISATRCFLEFESNGGGELFWPEGINHVRPPCDNAFLLWNVGMRKCINVEFEGIYIGIDRLNKTITDSN